MSRHISFVRLAVISVFIAALAMSGFSQPALNKALDFDGDGKADFSIFRRATGVWYIAGSMGQAIIQPFGNADDRLTPGDYDGDNKADIALFRESESGPADWHVLYSSNFTYTGLQWGGSNDIPVARDYDGDGKTDYAVARSGSDGLSWWVIKSTGGVIVHQFGAATDFVAPGDYDGDGKFDFAIQRVGSSPTDQGYFHILGSTVGYFSVAWGSSIDYVVPGDYDGDGKTDIAVVREGPTGADALTWYIIRSDGQSPGYIAYQWGNTANDYPAQGDYDGDGKTDVATWRQTDGIFYIINSSNLSFSGAHWGGPGDLPVAAYDTH